ncbi:MAG: bifunctional salicylyl-CoA 5-hydroxylase/oxidoreductase [Planctomycetia bacterium]
MKIACLGGGPAGLYFAILMKKAFPEAAIVVHERNKADDTFGFGVVFSDETLGNFEAADEPTYREIRRLFRYWGDIETHLGDEVVRSTGHGFCGMSRRRLLQVFHARCRELGVELRFESDVVDDSTVQADLVVACDGINSAVRARHADHFQPSLDWRKCKFTWLGTTLPMDAVTFWFERTEFGVFQVHAYPFEEGLGTFIVECTEEAWRAAGLDKADEAATIAFCERVFARKLGGHRLVANRSIWRTFPTVRCGAWTKGNLVLIGDAAHTAHFSIGSGTKLAMEDAIALRDVFVRHGVQDVPATLAKYEEARKTEVLKLQKAAQTSLEWFENSARYMDQDPVEFTFNLMTRSKRITYENLRKRDPELVRRATERYARAQGRATAAGRATPPPAFVPLAIRGVELANRIVVSPMCQYSAHEGVPGDWHLVHLGSRAIGGAGLVLAEATSVSSDGRITPGCTGLWNDAQRDAWKRIVDFVHASSGAKLGIQLGHAGRKASCSTPWEGDAPLVDARAWPTIGPSADAFKEGWHVPKAMTRSDMDRVRDDFVAATRRALAAGFDLLELHAAHGYLLSSFLSPLSNKRLDEHGGSLANRMRYPLEVVEAVRAAWPADKPLFVRISASDWLDAEGGFTCDDAVVLARELKLRGVDCVDVSSAGNSPRSRIDFGRMYQVPFADAIRHGAGVLVQCVGAVQGIDHANTVLAAGRADLVAMARPHLADPYLALHAAAEAGHEVPWPRQYLAAKPRPRAGEID